MKADCLTHLTTLPQAPGDDDPHGTPHARAPAHSKLNAGLFDPADAQHRLAHGCRDFATGVASDDPPDGETA